MKIVYSDRKTGRTGQAEVGKDAEGLLMGKRIDEVVDGAVAGLEGYKLQITGLSDKTGSPSRREIGGTIKSWPMLSSGPGIRKAKHGYRARKLVRGGAIGTDTEQVNTVILEYGSKPPEELFKPKEKKE